MNSLACAAREARALLCCFAFAAAPSAAHPLPARIRGTHLCPCSALLYMCTCIICTTFERRRQLHSFFRRGCKRRLLGVFNHTMSLHHTPPRSSFVVVVVVVVVVVAAPPFHRGPYRIQCIRREEAADVVRVICCCLLLPFPCRCAQGQQAKSDRERERDR